MNKREEWVRKILIVTMYLAASYKLYSLPQTHDIFDAIRNWQGRGHTIPCFSGNYFGDWIDPLGDQLDIPSRKPLTNFSANTKWA